MADIATCHKYFFSEIQINLYHLIGDSSCQNFQSNFFQCTYIPILQADSLGPGNVFKKSKHCSIIAGFWDIHWSVHMLFKQVSTSGYFNMKWASRLKVKMSMISSLSGRYHQLLRNILLLAARHDMKENIRCSIFCWMLPQRTKTLIALCMTGIQYFSESYMKHAMESTVPAAAGFTNNDLLAQVVSWYQY